MNLHEKVELSKLTIQYAVDKYPRVFTACSFGKDSRVLVDLAVQVKPDMLFIGIDTGYEFPETLAFAEDLVRETGINFRWVRPSEEAKRRIDAEYGDSFVRNDQYKCCEMKIPAIESVIGDFDAWLTGLRRDETQYRKNTKLLEQGKIAKINPIAFWTKKRRMELYREEEAAQSSALQRRLSVPWMPAVHDTRENPLGRRTTGAVRTRGTLRRNVPPRPGVRPPSDVEV